MTVRKDIEEAVYQTFMNCLCVVLERMGEILRNPGFSVC
jgi:hypothetical protein